ncbi:MAG: hypothetical protein KC478_07740 [Bacteriovoracaceae bacterium]|nr:hypothetical protein [Bacteriovoracaceae bacterium]
MKLLPCFGGNQVKITGLDNEEEFTLMRISVLAPLLFLSLSAHAQYYKTLPKGVRAAVFRNIQTTNIDSSYNQSESLRPMAYDINLDSSSLKALDDTSIQNMFNYVRDIYPEGFDRLSAGSFSISGAAKLSVNAYALAWGITDTVSVYGALPMYKAQVNMKYKRTKKNNFSEVADLYATETGNDMAQGFGSVFANAPDLINGSTIQNLLVQNYGYKEIGDWSAEGPGDMELGIMNNFLQKDKYGAMTTIGLIAPTGREDDPDILQDVAFGDGQWDVFAEIGGGYRLRDNLFINSFARYTYQFASEKEKRVPTSQDMSISDEKGSFYEKLGNKLLMDVDVDYIHSDWFEMKAAYLYETIGKANYESDYGSANDYLAANTDSSAHNVRLTGTFTSVTPYLKQKFLLPGLVKLSYQKMIHGRNTEKVDRYEVEFRMFF